MLRNLALSQPPPDTPRESARDPDGSRWERPLDASRPGRIARILRMRSLVWEAQLALLVWIIAAWFAYRTLTSHPPTESPENRPGGSERVDAAGF